MQKKGQLVKNDVSLITGFSDYIIALDLFSVGPNKPPGYGAGL